MKQTFRENKRYARFWKEKREYPSCDDKKAEEHYQI